MGQSLVCRNTVVSVLIVRNGKLCKWTIVVVYKRVSFFDIVCSDSGRYDDRLTGAIGGEGYSCRGKWTRAIPWIRVHTPCNR